MHSARGGVVAAVAGMMLLTGCAEPDRDGGTGGGEPTPQLSSFDPPLAFGDDIWLGDGYQADAFRVVDATLYTYRRSRSAISTWELATGSELGSVAVDLEGGAPQTGRDGQPYAFTDIDGRVALVVAYEHFERGVGTRPDQHYLRVRGYHADDGSVAWTSDVADAGLGDARILTSNADHTVIVTGARNPATSRVGREEGRVEGTSTVLDTVTGEVRQVWHPFVAHALDGEVVAGLHPDLAAAGSPNQPAHALEGRHVNTGETVWELPDALVSGADYFGYHAGGGVLVQPARSRGSSALVAGTRSTNLVLSVATGEVLVEIDHEGSAVECRHDGEQLLVCSQDLVDRAPPYLAAYDPHARTWLWDRDDIADGRELPSTVTAVHRGVIYMAYSSAGRRPVALDARTGADLAVDLPVAPDQVGAGYGLTYDEIGYLSVYPATG